MEGPTQVHPSRGRRGWLGPSSMVLGAAVLGLLLTVGTDIWLAPGPVWGALRELLTGHDVEQARQALGGVPEVMAAVLGLALTVSSIIVQLAATRFTPHVSTLFFQTRTNRVILGFFVAVTVYILWVNFMVGRDFVPRLAVITSLVLMTASLLVLFPYFAYVFHFLDPAKIIGRIQHNGFTATRLEVLAVGDLDERKHKALVAIDHLTDIGLNALQQRDRGITSDAIDALCNLVRGYGAHKRELPQQWHAIPRWLQQSPDFVSLSDPARQDLEAHQLWLEWKLLRQYQMLFSDALGSVREVCDLIAIDTRRIGEAAVERNDTHAIELVLKFFNTYLRATINAGDIRSAYNTLHQYRQLGEAVLASEDGSTHNYCVRIAEFLRYYSHTAYKRGLAFITEVIAHDVARLCEVAFNRDSQVHDRILPIFLTVDEPAETEEQERTLLGVRRAQIKLAATYLELGATSPAAAIREDMRDEPVARLRLLQRELSELKEREFWEVNDRGENFDYLSDGQKAQLAPFFAPLLGDTDGAPAGA